VIICFCTAAAQLPTRCRTLSNESSRTGAYGSRGLGEPAAIRATSPTTSSALMLWTSASLTSRSPQSMMIGPGSDMSGARRIAAQEVDATSTAMSKPVRFCNVAHAALSPTCPPDGQQAHSGWRTQRSLAPKRRREYYGGLWIGLRWVSASEPLYSHARGACFSSGPLSAAAILVHRRRFVAADSSRWRERGVRGVLFARLGRGGETWSWTVAERPLGVGERDAARV